MKYNNIGKMSLFDFINDDESYQSLVDVSERLRELDSASRQSIETKALLSAVQHIRGNALGLTELHSRAKPFWVLLEQLEDNYNALSRQASERFKVEIIKANRDDDLKDDGK